MSDAFEKAFDDLDGNFSFREAVLLQEGEEGQRVEVQNDISWIIGLGNPLKSAKVGMVELR